jgi:hypothetical protein
MGLRVSEVIFSAADRVKRSPVRASFSLKAQNAPYTIYNPKLFLKISPTVVPPNALLILIGLSKNMVHPDY